MRKIFFTVCGALAFSAALAMHFTHKVGVPYLWYEALLWYLVLFGGIVCLVSAAIKPYPQPHRMKTGVAKVFLQRNAVRILFVTVVVLLGLLWKQAGYPGYQAVVVLLVLVGSIATTFALLFFHSSDRHSTE